MPPNLTCQWTEDEDANWSTACSNLFVLITGTPLENGMRFCLFCGFLLDQRPFQEDPAPVPQEVA